MTLSVIGTGFGRTGTDSMRAALNQLGFGPCHHMHEVLAKPEQLFKGYQSTIDWPSAFYWRELTRVYPEARVLLTTRSTESWLASMNRTIFKVLRENTDPNSIGSKIIASGTFGGRLDDDDHASTVFEQHNAEVQRTIESERLLVYQLGDGWAPLCKFLRVPVPDQPFPCTNSASEFFSRSPDDP